MQAATRLSLSRRSLSVRDRNYCSNTRANYASATQTHDDDDKNNGKVPATTIWSHGSFGGKKVPLLPLPRVIARHRRRKAGLRRRCIILCYGAAEAPRQQRDETHFRGIIVSFATIDARIERGWDRVFLFRREWLTRLQTESALRQSRRGGKK